MLVYHENQPLGSEKVQGIFFLVPRLCLGTILRRLCLHLVAEPQALRYKAEPRNERQYNPGDQRKHNTYFHARGWLRSNWASHAGLGKELKLLFLTKKTARVIFEFCFSMIYKKWRGKRQPNRFLRISERRNHIAYDSITTEIREGEYSGNISLNLPDNE